MAARSPAEYEEDHVLHQPAGYDAELWALVAPLRAAVAAQGITYGQLSYRLGLHRSRVSRALSGRVLPARDRVLQLARILGVDEAAVALQWDRAAAKMRDPGARREARVAGGAPPSRLASHKDVMNALRDLLQDRGISQRELERRNSDLCRSTVGAMLRCSRGASRSQVTAIVFACDVHGAAADAWEAAWEQYCRPDLVERQRRSDACLKRTAVPLRDLYRW